MNSNYFKSLLLLIITTFTFFEASSQCIVTAYAKNITANCGTSTQTYDVVVEFSNIPSSGNLRLRSNSNSTIATTAVSSLSGTSTYTFTGLNFNMNLGEPDIYVDFSTDASCRKYLHIPLYECNSYPANSTAGTYVATVTNGKKYTTSGSDEYVLNYNGALTLKHNGDYLAAFKTSLFQNVEYFFYSCKPDVTKHPYLSKCNIVESNGTLGAYNSNIPAFPNPDLKEISLGNASDIINYYTNTFTENKVWVMPSVNDFLGANVTIPANYFANGSPFSIQYLNQITATTTENCAGGSISFTNLLGGYPEFHASNYTITNNAGGTLTNTSVASNGSFSLTGLTNGANYDITISDTNGGQSNFTGTFCNIPTTAACGTCATPTCPIAGPYNNYNTANTNNLANCNVLSPSLNGPQTLISYYRVIASSGGIIGAIISNGNDNSDGITPNCEANRTAVLYLPSNCSSSTNEIPPSTTTANGSAYYNPEWTGLTPGAVYTMKVITTIANNCQIFDQCVSYYQPDCPTVNPVSNKSSCEGAIVGAINFSSPSSTGSITYSWTNSNTAIGLPASDVGNIRSYRAPVVTTTQVATITVTASNGVCSGVPITFTITINPKPSTPTVSYTGPTCASSGISTISNYIAGLNYTFAPSGPNVSTSGIISGMIAGTSYTVAGGVGACASTPTAPFSNETKLTTPALPTIASVAATCIAAGTSTISNFDATLTYNFSPTGPTVATGGLISGMTLGTTYTVSASNANCTSLPTASFSNADLLITPALPAIASVAPTCISAGTSTISNFDATLTYNFNPGGPTVTAGGLINGMTLGTAYTVRVRNANCTSATTASFSNAGVLITPILPTIVSGAATCNAAGTTTISNFDATLTYNFSPTGPTVATGGLISGMTLGTAYTVSASNTNCTTTTTASFSNADLLTTPALPTIASVAPTCFAAGTSTISNFDATLIYNFSPTGPAVTTAGLISGMTLGTAYTVSASNTNCTSTPTASFSNSILLTTPGAPTVNTPVNYCIGDIAIPLTASGVNLLWYETINGAGSIIAPTPSTTTIGSTTYYVSQTLGTCESPKTAIVVTISTTSISLEAGCIDADYTLTATAPAGTTFKWYQGTTLLSNTTNTLVITSPGNYRVVGTLNGCSIDATENATFTYCEIPKGISPNGDGLNDNFDLSNLKVKHLQIFNRYGMEMYSKANYKNEWNGYSDSGLNLPDGTYYYIIHFESGKTKTGWVYKNNER